jgi:proteic killer suppression protein
MQKICSSERESHRQWGTHNSRKIRRRLAELRAAETLADIGTLPTARLHPLHGKRSGQFAVDVAHPFRLVLEPLHNPLPYKADGGIDVAKITKVRILDVTPYH